MPRKQKREKEKTIMGAGIPANILQKVIQLSYDKSLTDMPEGYLIDRTLSDGRVKVYVSKTDGTVLEVHRGSSSAKDWIDNASYSLGIPTKFTGTFKTHQKKHNAVVAKYGAENIILIGHSRASLYIEELNRNQPVKSVITYNAASPVGGLDILRKTPGNQTNVRESRDLISLIKPLQRKTNDTITIPSEGFDFAKIHSSDGLGKLGNTIIGKGISKANLKIRMKECNLKLCHKCEGNYKPKTVKEMKVELEVYEKDKTKKQKDIIIGSGAGASTHQDEKKNVFIKKRRIHIRAQTIANTVDLIEFNMAMLNASVPVRNEVRRIRHWSGNPNHPKIYIEEEI